MNKDNLRRLLKVLKSKKKLPITLEMTMWHSISPYGTQGCLLGLSHYVVTSKAAPEGWDTFGERVFDLKYSSSEYEFLFSFIWGYNKKTNTKAHAIKRIEFILKHARTPENWNLNWGT